MKSKNISDLVKMEVVRYDHMAIHKGYVSRKLAVDNFPATKYNGRFGSGYIVKYPRYDSTRYITCYYYIAHEGWKYDTACDKWTHTNGDVLWFDSDWDCWATICDCIAFDVHIDGKSYQHTGTDIYKDGYWWHEYYCTELDKWTLRK